MTASSSSSSSSSCDSSTSSSSSTFSVSFAPYAYVCDTIHLRDYSPSEKASCWYNKFEKQLIRKEVKRTKMLMSLLGNIDSDIICTLGLEKKRKQRVTEEDNIDDDDDSDDDDEEMVEVQLDDEEDEDDDEDDDKENATPYYHQRHLPKMIVTEI